MLLPADSILAGQEWSVGFSESPRETLWLKARVSRLDRWLCSTANILHSSPCEDPKPNSLQNLGSCQFCRESHFGGDRKEEPHSGSSSLTPRAIQSFRSSLLWGFWHLFGWVGFLKIMDGNTTCLLLMELILQGLEYGCCVSWMKWVCPIACSQKGPYVLSCHYSPSLAALLSIPKCQQSKPSKPWTPLSKRKQKTPNTFPYILCIT